ncbi:MAG: hypothetical protein JWR69_1298 [Pedosphaera sp.]|nr:hypothetical protein [Pedosphaera sp.]
MRLNLNHQVTPDIRGFPLRTCRLTSLVGLALLLFALLLAPPLRAQNSKPPILSSNRFLYVFDISAPMHRQATVVQKATQDILESRASGQLHYGDTIGVWSFDAEVHAGFFPLQTWLPGEEREIALRIGEYVKQQPVGKKSSRQDKVLEAVSDLIKNSHTITIFLFSTGESPMRGTPFDDAINAAYQRTLKDMKQDRMPIVTVLQAKDGKLLTYTVNALPWAVVIPELPIPIKAPRAVATSSTPAPTAKPPVVAPRAPEPAVAVPPPVATVPAPQPKAAVSAIQATPPPPRVAPAPIPTTRLEPPAVPAPAPALPVPPTPQPAPVVAAPKPDPAPAPTPAPLPKTPALAEAAPQDQPSADAHPSPRLNPVKSEPSASKSTVPSQPLEVVAKSTNSPLVQPAMALPPGASPRPKMLLIGAVALFGLAIALLVFALRRSRTAAGPSLITRSLNNHRK